MLDSEMLAIDYWRGLQTLQSTVVVQSVSVATVAIDNDGLVIKDSEGNVTYTFPSFIDIDLGSRAIKLEESDYKDFIAISKDHRAKTIYFRCDRFYDDVDLAHITTVVEYINAAGESRLYPVTLKDIRSEPGKLLFGWCLGAEATETPGTIKFAIHFYTVTNDANDRRFLYSLHTLPVNGTILKSISDTSKSTDVDYDEIYQYEPSMYEMMEARIQNLENNAVSWIDV